MRQGASVLWLIPGLANLALFAWLLTLAPSEFAGRGYEAHGGVYTAASLVWPWAVEKQRPATWDLTGAAICLAGIAVTQSRPLVKVAVFSTGIDAIAGVVLLLAYKKEPRLLASVVRIA